MVCSGYRRITTSSPSSTTASSPPPTRTTGAHSAGTTPRPSCRSHTRVGNKNTDLTCCLQPGMCCFLMLSVFISDASATDSMSPQDCRLPRPSKAYITNPWTPVKRITGPHRVTINEKEPGEMNQHNLYAEAFLPKSSLARVLPTSLARAKECAGRLRRSGGEA